MSFVTISRAAAVHSLTTHGYAPEVAAPLIARVVMTDGLRSFSTADAAAMTDPAAQALVLAALEPRAAAARPGLMSRYLSGQSADDVARHMVPDEFFVLDPAMRARTLSIVATAPAEAQQIFLHNFVGFAEVQRSFALFTPRAWSGAISGYTGSLSTGLVDHLVRSGDHDVIMTIPVATMNARQRAAAIVALTDGWTHDPESERIADLLGTTGCMDVLRLMTPDQWADLYDEASDARARVQAAVRAAIAAGIPNATEISRLRLAFHL